jgi:hypothetical protein
MAAFSAYNKLSTIDIFLRKYTIDMLPSLCKLDGILTVCLKIFYL